MVAFQSTIWRQRSHENVLVLGLFRLWNLVQLILDVWLYIYIYICVSPGDTYLTYCYISRRSSTSMIFVTILEKWMALVGQQSITLRTLTSPIWTNMNCFQRNRKYFLPSHTRVKMSPRILDTAYSVHASKISYTWPFYRHVKPNWPNIREEWWSKSDLVLSCSQCQPYQISKILPCVTWCYAHVWWTATLQCILDSLLWYTQ